MMNDSRMSQLKVRKHVQFPQGGNVTRSGELPSPLSLGDVPYPHGALHAVCSTIQLGHLNTLWELTYHDFRNACFHLNCGQIYDYCLFYLPLIAYWILVY